MSTLPSCRCTAFAAVLAPADLPGQPCVAARARHARAGAAQGPARCAPGFQLPAGFVFQIGSAFKDARRGVIRLDYIRSPDAWWATRGLRDLLRGPYQSTDHMAMALVPMDLRSGQARQDLLPRAAELPRVDPRFVGQRYRHVLVSERVAAGPRRGYDAVTRIDVQSGRAGPYRYGTEVLAEEHIFVPRVGATETTAGRWARRWTCASARCCCRSSMRSTWRTGPPRRACCRA